MSRVNPRLVYWLASLHDHKELTDKHHRVLSYLVTRKLDFGTGKGYCSEKTLADECGAGVSTVREALTYAREHGLIVRTRRGIGVRDGDPVASEWQVIYPPLKRKPAQPTESQGSVDGEPTASQPAVGSGPTASQPATNRQLAGNQPPATDLPTGSEGFQEVSNTSLSRDGSRSRSQWKRFKAACPKAEREHFDTLKKNIRDAYQRGDPRVQNPYGLLNGALKAWDRGDEDYLRDLARDFIKNYVPYNPRETGDEINWGHGGGFREHGTF